MIWTFKQLPPAALSLAGGKGGALARLAQAGFAVPPGFVISAEGFVGERLRAEAWASVQKLAADLRGSENALLAVRSSAQAEDAATASFAGEFETVLNVAGDAALRESIEQVYGSRHSARVRAYTEAQALDGAHEMSVLVQRMVPAQLAGVLFTAEPLHGKRDLMVGSFVRGLGEALVSGEESGEQFTLAYPRGAYKGPAAMRPYARRLFGLGERLAQELDGPQDVEWAIAGGKLWLLQSRPISTMQAYDPLTGIWNDSLRGDYVWSNANFGEAIPGVMTPLTWSLVRIYFEETFDNPLPGDHDLMGNIGGRLYINISLFASMMKALGFGRERMNHESQELIGNLPEDVEIPFIPFTRWQVLRGMAPFMVDVLRRRARNLPRLAGFSAEAPAHSERLRQNIASAETAEALAALWETEFEPLLRRSYQMMQVATSRYENRYRPLQRKLAEQVGDEDANLLLSGVSEADEHLESLGLLLGLWQVAHGELSREAYLQRYGHRGLHEFELSWARPAEDPQWMDRQLATLADVDVPALLARRRAQKEAAWAHFVTRFPRQAKGMQEKLIRAAEAARGREAVRSETTRLLAVARAFALRAGMLSGLGEDVFYLRLHELLAALRGDGVDLGQIAVRRAAHEQLSSLPPYPALIRGRFDPFAWAANGARRSDIYDASPAQVPVGETSEGLVRGLPASAGVVEGVVRRLHAAAEGHQLQEGEILVAVTTNVGWTPFFPRAAAVVTDVGAPLSHAAIVARELGIPAVVGTGNATMQLKTGDRVRVDGTRGVVERLNGQP